MTAMPPTIGHRNLIRFANNLSAHTTVIVCTQPGEPFVNERFWALSDACKSMGFVSIQRIHRELPQEPEGQEGYWDMWVGFLKQFGFQTGDAIVSSELYGKKLAEEAGGKWYPFDIDRSITYTKATQVREDYREHWNDILPEFRPYLKKRITLFGAESVGKTTTADLLAGIMPNTKWYFEWARPYLEAEGPEITVEKMQDIYDGQMSLQRMASRDRDSEFDIFDTDLYSTLGYWEMWDKESCPKDLAVDAFVLRSDLYVILSSDIPFEPDQLRLGGDNRETPDQYWIDLCKAHNLPYVYVTQTFNRHAYVMKEIFARFPGTELSYRREGKEYENGLDTESESTYK